MMGRYVIRLLWMLNVVVGLVLAWLWFTPEGAVRNVRWAAPEPQKPNFAAMVPELPAATQADTTRFVAMLDKPLFSPSRRPPPPPPPPAAAPPPDPLANIQLFGVFVSAEGGGILARVDGKNRRITMNDSIGAWKIKSIKDRDVTLVSGSETRVLHLSHAKPVVPQAPAAEPAAPGAAPPQSTGPAAAPAASAQGFIRDRQRARNEARVKAGLPPLP